RSPPGATTSTSPPGSGRRGSVRRAKLGEKGEEAVRAKVLLSLTWALSTPYARPQPVARGLTSGLGQATTRPAGGGPMRKLVSLATLSCVLLSVALAQEAAKEPVRSGPPALADRFRT